jgi:cellulose synthase/poly-beta-1,6-N-acetylglucosamine synthase-like glycosyltransferase
MSSPFITVVVAARNEEHSLDACLRALTTQSYPGTHYEIIVVNDQSEDCTAEVAQRFSGVRVFHTSPLTSGKKGALSLGIEAAHGEIIATTDADCIVSPEWLATIALAFDPGIHMVTGPVLYPHPGNLFERFQALDIAGLALITASGLRSRLHTLANGGNMAFRRDSYDRTGGLERHRFHASGDDLFLVQQIRKAYPEGIRFLWGRHAVVYSRPGPTCTALIRQRIRWASKNRALPEKSVHRIWAGIWLVFVLNLLVLITGFWVSRAITLVAGFCILCIFVMEFLLLRRVTNYYGIPEIRGGFLLPASMHYMYVVFIGTLALLRQDYIWKGRLAR